MTLQIDTGVLWNVTFVVNQSRSLLSCHAGAPGAMDEQQWVCSQDVGNAVRIGSASWLQVTVIACDSWLQRAERN